MERVVFIVFTGSSELSLVMGGLLWNTLSESEGFGCITGFWYSASLHTHSHMHKGRHNLTKNASPKHTSAFLGAQFLRLTQTLDPLCFTRTCSPFSHPIHLMGGKLTCHTPVFLSPPFFPFQSTVCILIRASRVPRAVCLSVVTPRAADWLASCPEVWNEPTGGYSLAWALVKPLRTS